MLNYMYEYFTLLFATANKNHKKKKNQSSFGILTQG